MPFSSTASKFFGRFGASQSDPQTSGLGDSYNKLSAIKSPNLFETIQAVRQNEMDRQYKQAQIAKVLQDLNNPIDSEYKQAQIQALKDKSDYQSGLLDEKQRNQDRLTAQQAIIANLLKGQLGGEGGSNIPVGSSARVGGMYIPLNPRLTDTEQAAIAGSQSLEPVVSSIIENIQGGIFGKNPLKRTARQSIIDSDNTMLSSQDAKLQSFQQDLANLKRLIPFTDGGKQLTPFEAKRVFALLNTVGKNDAQASKDINRAVDIVMRKGGLAIGGRNAAVSSVNNNSSLDSQSELDAINKRLEELGG